MKKILYKVFICLFAVIMVISATYLIKYYASSYIADHKQKEFATLINNSEQSNQEIAPDSINMTEDYSDQYAELIAQYPDFVGWISIPGTRIDYPVMQKDGEGTDYFYLDHDYSGEKSSSGAVFVNEVCDLQLPSNNIIIYGHNMKSGTMFHDLLKYKEKDFCTNYPYITFDSIYRPGLYKVVAAFYTRVSDDEPSSDEFFKYYDYVDMVDQDVFDEYIQTCKRLSLYSTNTEVTFGDELITLSTCSYHLDDGSERFVVVAKKLDV